MDSLSKFDELVFVSERFRHYEEDKKKAALGNHPPPQLPSFYEVAPSQGLPRPSGPLWSDYFLTDKGKRQVEELAELQDQSHNEKKLKYCSSPSGASNKRKKVATRTMPVEDEKIPPGLWQEKHEEMEGSRPVWLGVKVITSSDTKKCQNRLLLPGAIRSRVYREVADDWSKIDGEATGLSVDVLDQLGKEYKMNCKYRSYEKNHGRGFMVLIGSGWRKFVETNDLREDDRLTIASFRSGGSLKFLLYKMQD